MSPLLDVLKSSLRHIQQNIASAALSVLREYSARILSDAADESLPHTNSNNARRTKLFIEHATPSVIDRLGDAKERTKQAASVTLVEIGMLALKDSAKAPRSGKGKATHGQDKTLEEIFVQLYLDHGLKNKQAKIREQVRSLVLFLRRKSADSLSSQCLHSLVQLKNSHPSLHIKPFLTSIVEALQDADSKVRDQARETIISIFKTSAPAARADLHREMEQHGLKKSLQEAIMKEVSGAGGQGAEENGATNSTPQGEDGQTEGHRPSVGSAVPEVYVSIATYSASSIPAH